MGSIVNFNKYPSTWYTIDSGRKVKATGEPLVYVEYGSWDDDAVGPLPIGMYMRKSILDKILSHAYGIHYDFGNGSIVVYDRATNLDIPKLASYIY